MKKVKFLIVVLFSIILLSCKKECVNCHQIKVYEGEQRGVFEILAVEEACGALEQRKFVRQANPGEDDGGKFEIFWECDLYPESDTSLAENQ